MKKKIETKNSYFLIEKILYLISIKMYKLNNDLQLKNVEDLYRNKDDFRFKKKILYFDLNDFIFSK